MSEILSEIVQSELLLAIAKLYSVSLYLIRLTTSIIGIYTVECKLHVHVCAHLKTHNGYVSASLPLLSCMQCMDQCIQIAGLLCFFLVYRLAFFIPSFFLLQVVVGLATPTPYIIKVHYKYTIALEASSQMSYSTLLDKVCKKLELSPQHTKLR